MSQGSWCEHGMIMLGLIWEIEYLESQIRQKLFFYKLHACGKLLNPAIALAAPSVNLFKLKTVTCNYYTWFNSIVRKSTEQVNTSV